MLQRKLVLKKPINFKNLTKTILYTLNLKKSFNVNFCKKVLGHCYGFKHLNIQNKYLSSIQLAVYFNKFKKKLFLGL